MKTKNIKDAIKIANQIKKDLISFDYNVTNPSYNDDYCYADAWTIAGARVKTFSKTLYNNKEIRKHIGNCIKISLVICDQTATYCLEKYGDEIREIDSLTSSAYIKRFNADNIDHLEKKAIEILARTKPYLLHDKLVSSLPQKIEAPRKSVKI